MPSELHLFIIWSKGRYKEQEIITDLQKHFEILAIYEITWTKKNFIKNLCRFYGAHFYKGQEDVEGRGKETFILITFLDHNPCYAATLTSSGHAVVNTHILGFKNKYRDWVQNNFAIHSSVTTSETKHDLSLLLGDTYDTYLNTFLEKSTKKGVRHWIQKDIVGANGWKNIEEVFKILNECSVYTMLRDFTSAASELGQTSDIDLLVDDMGLEIVPFIINASPYEDNVVGTFMCDVIIGNQSIPFHLHSFSYLSPRWVKDILKTRFLSNNKLYLPSEEQQFYVLFYQIFYKKLIIKQKYKNFLAELDAKLCLVGQESSVLFDDYPEKLNSFLDKKHYSFNLPQHVRDNPIDFLETVKENIECLGITNIKPYKIDLWKAGLGSKFFTGLYDNKKVLIKYFGQIGMLKKEFQVIDFLNRNTNLQTPKPIFYRSLRAGHQFLVTDFIIADSLADFPIKKKSSIFKKKVIQGIVHILSEYKKYGFIHRDIGPSNILIDSNANVYLIDFEYLIDTKQKVLKQQYDYSHSLASLYQLGVPNNLRTLAWNDAYSAIKIIESFEPELQKKYLHFYTILKDYVHDKTLTYTLNKKSKDFIKQKLKWRLAHILERLHKIGKKISRRVN